MLTERVRRDGSRVQVSLTMAPIRDEDGRADRRLDHGARRDRVAASGRGAHAPRGHRAIDERRRRRHGPRGPGHRLQHGGGRDVRADRRLDRHVRPRRGRRRRVPRARRADIVRRAGSGETLAYEAARLDGEGRRFVLANTIGPIQDDEGEITGIAAIARDITEQRKAQEQQRWLAAVVDSSRDAIIGLGLDGTIVSWNPAAARTFGWTDEEAIGRPGGTCSSRRSAGAATPSSCAGSPRATPFEDEAERGRRRDGTTFAATVTGFPVRDAHGSVHAAAFIVRDVTEQRRLEEQLEQARRMEAVGRLAGGVAHDFNNLLTVISGYAALLRAEADGDSTELEEIDRAARRATELTGQLLAFSRQRSANPALIDLAGVLDGVMPMLGRLIGEHIAISVMHHGRPASPSSPTRARWSRSSSTSRRTPATRCPTAAR